MLPFGFMKELSGAVSKLVDEIDMDEARRLYETTGVKGRIVVENTEILFMVREKRA